MVDGSEQRLTGGTFSAVHRRGDEVLRRAQPWSPTTIGLLSHLHRAGFSAAPAPVGDGLAADGRSGSPSSTRIPKATGPGRTWGSPSWDGCTADCTTPRPPTGRTPRAGRPDGLVTCRSGTPTWSSV